MCIFCYKFFLILWSFNLIKNSIESILQKCEKISNLSKKITIEVELGELPEQTYVKSKSSKKENKPKEEKIKSLGITIKDNSQSDGVTVTKVANEEINLDIGDIILEVNREIVESIKSFTSLVEKYKETGRSSLLLKMQRGEETSWVTIKFVDN